MNTYNECFYIIYSTIKVVHSVIVKQCNLQNNVQKIARCKRSLHLKSRKKFFSPINKRKKKNFNIL